MTLGGEAAEGSAALGREAAEGAAALGVEPGATTGTTVYARRQGTEPAGGPPRQCRPLTCAADERKALCEPLEQLHRRACPCEPLHIATSSASSARHKLVGCTS